MIVQDDYIKAIKSSKKIANTKVREGKVSSIAADGYLVYLNPSVATKCKKYTDASVGDTVLVLTSGGKSYAIARKR